MGTGASFHAAVPADRNHPELRDLIRSIVDLGLLPRTHWELLELEFEIVGSGMVAQNVIPEQYRLPSLQLSHVGYYAIKGPSLVADSGSREVPVKL